MTWSISGNNSAGTTISADVRLTIAANETSWLLTVTAASTTDPSKSCTVTVVVIPHIYGAFSWPCLALYPFAALL